MVLLCGRWFTLLYSDSYPIASQRKDFSEMGLNSCNAILERKQKWSQLLQIWILNTTALKNEEDELAQSLPWCLCKFTRKVVVVGFIWTFEYVVFNFYNPMIIVVTVGCIRLSPVVPSEVSRECTFYCVDECQVISSYYRQYFKGF